MFKLPLVALAHALTTFPMMFYNLNNGYRPHLGQHCFISLLILTGHFDGITCYLESWNGYPALFTRQKIFGAQIQSKESINDLSGQIFVQKYMVSLFPA